MARVEPVAVGPRHRPIDGRAEQVAAQVGQRRRIDPEKGEHRRRQVGLPCRHRTRTDQIRLRPTCPACPDEHRHPIVEHPGGRAAANPNRARQRRVAREAGVVVAEDHEHAVVEQAVFGERRLEVLERLIEKAHGVQVVAERGALERAERQHLVRLRKRVERMVQRQGDEPRAKGPRQLFEPRHHLLEEVAIVQPPADLLGHLEVRLEQALLEPVRRMHHLPVPESRLERHRRQRRVSVLGQDARQRRVVVPGKAERDRAVIQRQQRRQRRQLRVRGAAFAGLIGHVGEAQAVAGPPAQVRHHLLSADRVVDREVLQRFDLHDDQVAAACRAERRPAGAQWRALAQPVDRVLHLGRRRRRSQPRAAHIVPGVVRVIAERPDLLDDRAGAEHLIERRRGEHARRGHDRAADDQRGERDRGRRQHAPA